MNARKELEQAIARANSKVVCATVQQLHDYTFDVAQEFNLVSGYTPEEFEAFMQKLDFEYDSGYGLQELEGTVWFENGTWLKRGEYDGSEWWELMSRPTIPDYLMKKEGPALAYGVYNDMNKNK